MIQNIQDHSHHVPINRFKPTAIENTIIVLFDISIFHIGIIDRMAVVEILSITSHATVDTRQNNPQIIT